MPKLVCSLAAGLMLVNSTATAHSWYPHECCSENDCHPVPCAELVLTPEGDVKWKGVLYFSRRMVRLSLCLSPAAADSYRTSVSAHRVAYRTDGRRDSALPDPRHILAAADADGAAFDPDGARVDLKEMSRVAIAVVDVVEPSRPAAGPVRH